MYRSFLLTILIFTFSITSGILFAQGYWFQQYTPNGTPELNDIQFITKDKGWCVGNSGTILRTTNGGTNWIGQNSTTYANLYGVCFVNDQIGYACGSGGIIVKSTNGGSTWFKPIPNIDPSLKLNDIFFQDQNIGWVVGQNSAVHRTLDGGINWTAQTPAGSSDFFAIKKMPLTSGGTLYVCGENGKVFKTNTDGPPWTDISIPVNPSKTNKLFDIALLSKDIGFICSSEDTVYKTTNEGTSWTPYSAGSGGPLGGITMVGLQTGWTIFSGASIPYTTNGGATWTIQSSPISEEMNAICSFTNNFAWACGKDGKIIKYSTLTPSISTIGTLEFGTLLCELDLYKTFAVKNVGTGLLEISAAEIKGIDKFEFALSSPQSFPLSINAQDSVVFTIHWKPFALGAKNAYIDITHNDVPHNPTAVQFAGQKDSTEITLGTTALNFPPTCVGESSEASIDVNVKGTETVLITEVKKISGDNTFEVYAPSIPVSVAAGGHVPISVRFIPTSSGNSSAVFHLKSTPCDRELTFTASGTGKETKIISFPDPVLLGDVIVGKPVSKIISITTPGPTYANVIAIYFDPPVPGLTLVNPLSVPFKINPSEQKFFTIKFEPTDTVTVSTQLCIEYDKVCPGKKCIPIEGRGIVNPHIIIAPVLNFEPLICESSIIDTVEVQNTGSGPLIISNIEISGKDPSNFTVIEPLIPARVEVGETLNLVIQFSPTDAGDKGALMRLTHNDTWNNPTDITIMGRKDVVGFIVSGDTIASINVCVGKSKSAFYTIENTGSIALRIDDIITSNGNAPFVIRGVKTPFTIAPQGSQIIEVVFSPIKYGAYLTAFTVKSDKCGFEHVFRVDGIGLKSEFTALSPIDFGNVLIGGSVTKSASIRNTGTLTSQVDSVFIYSPVLWMTLESPPTVPFILDTNQVKTFNIKFVPTSEGVFNTYLCFVITKDCPDTVRIPIYATGTSASLTVSKSFIDAALPLCGVIQRCDSLLLQNPGTSPITIRLITIQQTRGTFSISNAPSTPYELKGGDNLPLLLCTNMPFAGADSAKLIIESSDTKRPTIELALRARRDSVGIFYSASSLNFGTLPQCDTSKTVHLSLTNTGSLTDTVQLSQPVNTAFQIIGSLTRIINSKKSEDVEVKFIPPAQQSFASSINVQTKLCGNAYNINLIGERVRAALQTSSSNISFDNVSVNTTSIKSIALQNTSSFSILIDSILFRPANDGFSTTYGAFITVDSGKSLNVPLSFLPTVVKSYSGDVCFVLSKPCRDTVCVALTGNGVRNNLSLSTTKISFGEKAKCESHIDSVICTNSGTSPITITRSSIAPVSAVEFQLLNPTTSDEILSPGASRTYRITFSPSSVPDGIRSASLRIETFDSQTSSIDIPLDGKRVSPQISYMSLIDFGIVSIGSPASRNVTIKNSGSIDFSISSNKLPAMFTSSMSFPQQIKPNDSLTLSLSFIPFDTSSVSGTMYLYLNKPCTDSVLITLSGKGKESAITQTPLISYGVLPQCIAKTDTIVLTNNSTSTITVQSFALVGSDSSLFTIVNKPALPLDIQSGSKVLIVLSFDGSKSIDGNKQATLKTTFTNQGKDESRYTMVTAETSTPMIEIRSERSFGDVVFPSTVVGQMTVRSITLKNISKVPVSIISVQTNNSTFKIQSSTPSIPTTILPGDSVRVDISFSPTQEKNYLNLLIVDSDTPCAFTMQKNLIGAGIAGNVIASALRIGTLHGKLDEVIDIPIMLETDIGSAHVSKYSGDVQFNRTMLYPVGIRHVNTLSKDMSVRMIYDHKQGAVHIDADGGDVLSGTGTLVILQCKVLLGNDVETPISITPEFDFTQGNARVVQRTNGLFQLEGYCRAGDRLLKIDGNYLLKQNHPNPISLSVSTTTATKIEYEIGLDGYVSLILYDALGREVKRLVDEWKASGKYVINYNPLTITPGVYYYILRSGKFIDGKKMIVVR